MTEISPRLKDRLFSFPKSVSRAFGATGSHAAGYTDAGSALAGALTFFLPCGFTQAMQVYAVASGSAVGGAAVMVAFALGGTPPLMGIGGIASVLRGRAGRFFYVAAGLLVLVMSAFNLKVGGSMLAAYSRLRQGVDFVVVEEAAGVQEIRTVQSGLGYYPNEHTVRRGIPVRWVIVSKTEFTCSSAIVIPQLGISRSLKLGENVIEFTPTENIDISFSCASGLYEGKIKVID